MLTSSSEGSAVTSIFIAACKILALWGPFADPFQIFRCQFQIPRRSPRSFAALKNNLHPTSFVTEKDMCTYAQVMKSSNVRGLRFLGRAKRSGGARALLRIDSQ
jgi:hypothetical protein